jgi:hypothetical protein
MPTTPTTPSSPHPHETKHETQHDVEINLSGEISNAFSDVFNRGFRYAFGVNPDGTADNIPNPDIDTMPEAPFVYVHNRLGNVTINVDATISEPHLMPEAEHDEANNAKTDIFRLRDQDKSYPEDVFMVKLFTHSNSTLRIPKGYAVYLDSGAGNVRISDVSRVFGTVNAGNVNMTDVTSLSLVVNAGNAKVSGRFASGEHRLVTNAGNAKVYLQDGSSLTISARVTAGNIKHKGQWEDVTVVREMMGGKLEGRIGSSRGNNNNATMTLKAKAGNINVYAPDAATTNTATTNTATANTYDSADHDEGNSDD